MNDEAMDFIPDRERAADADATVPVIDIAGFSGGDEATRRRIVQEVTDACERVGFFVITGHDVPHRP
jgi:isopenicillin N synthase-like dioxygenase